MVKRKEETEAKPTRPKPLAYTNIPETSRYNKKKVRSPKDIQRKQKTACIWGTITTDRRK